MSAYGWMAGKRNLFITILPKPMNPSPVLLVFQIIKDWLMTVPKIETVINRRTASYCARMIRTIRTKLPILWNGPAIFPRSIRKILHQELESCFHPD